jgi:hypothetical protein
MFSGAIGVRDLIDIDVKSLKTMLSPQDFCGALTDDDTGRHGVSGRNAGYD